MLCFPMLISPLPGANPPLHEHKIGVFVRFWGLEPSFFRPFEHKIGVFVRFWGWEPLFSGFSSTKWFFVKFRAVKLSKFGRF